MGKFFSKKSFISGLIFGVVFGVSCFEAYKLTPANLIKSDKTLNKVQRPMGSEEEEDYGPSYFGQFAAKMTNAIDEESEENLGLGGKFNNFTVKYPSKDKLTTNTLKIDGDINVVMSSLTDLDLSVDLMVNYNNQPIDFALGFVDKDLYFVLNDLKIKSTYNSTLDILEYIHEAFFDPENENGLGMSLDVEGLIGSLVDKIDLGALDVSAIKATEKEVGDNVVIDLSIKEIAIQLTVGKQDLVLRKVDLGELNLGDVTISGAIDFDVIDSVLKLDDPLYPKQRGEFVEAISYIGWVDNMLNLFNARNLGLDLKAQINLLDGENKSLLADISSKIDLNCANVFDFNNLNISELVEKIENSTFEVSSLFNLDNLEFGVDLVTRGQQDETYANLNLSYFEKAAYLTLNETADDAVMRAKINNQTLSQLLEVTPNLVDAIDGLKNKEVPKEEIKEASDDIFGFITSSDLIKGIKNNDFSGIIKMIKKISNDANKIYLDVDLSSLGLGANSEVDIVIDSSKPENKKVLSIDVKNVVVSSVEINLSLNTSKYSATRISEIKAKKDTFDDLSFIPGIITQASDILNEKKGKLSIDGSILDENNEGILISGAAQFDANENVGYGSLNLRQQDSKVKNANKYIDHKIDFDINNKGEVNSDKNALFVYNSELKAKVTVQTFVDIIDLGKDLLNSDDERFTKFKDLLTESLISGAINDIIDNKDYLLIAKPTFIKSLKQENSGNTIRVVISGDLVGMDTDINVCINFKDTEEGKRLSGIALSGIQFSGKTIELSFGLNDYDEFYVSPVNKADNFMDFSQVKVLLDFGINTTKINYYHLTAKVTANLSILQALKVDLDFHITVDGKKTRVYGSIPKIPWLTDIVSDDLATTTVSTEFVFEPTEDVGGLFHIVKNADHTLWFADEVIYYQSDSDNFVKNILQYLVCDMLNIKPSMSDKLANANMEAERDPNFAKMFTSTGFKYAKNQSTGVNTWNIGINMAQILGNDTLGDLELELKGQDKEKSGLFTSAHVELDIVSILTLKADITLKDPSFETETWPDSIEKKYDKVLSWYGNLSEAKKADFDANYKNKPLKGYTMISQKNYF